MFQRAYKLPNQTVSFPVDTAHLRSKWIDNAFINFYVPGMNKNRGKTCNWNYVCLLVYAVENFAINNITRFGIEGCTRFFPPCNNLFVTVIIASLAPKVKGDESIHVGDTTRAELMH